MNALALQNITLDVVELELDWSWVRRNGRRRSRLCWNDWWEWLLRWHRHFLGLSNNSFEKRSQDGWFLGSFRSFVRHFISESLVLDRNLGGYRGLGIKNV